MKRLFYTLNITVCANVTSFAQSSTLGNNSRTSIDYLGWGNITNFPLAIRHNRNDQPIGMFTNNLQRLRINAGNANLAINGF